jgi:hypothetical protein
MIEQLRTPLSAYFFRRKAPITQRAVRALFVDLLRDAHNPSRPVFRVERQVLGDSRFSAIAFAYDRPTQFLEGTPQRMDRIHGFLLLVEKGATVALFKVGLDLTARFKKDHLDPIGRGRVERAIARHDAVFERLSLRNMTTSRFALRSKTLEARDLENAIAVSSAGRFIPQGYRVRRGDGSYSATPSTGRIAVRSDRADYVTAVAWAGDIMTLLGDEEAISSPFIRNFARPVELSQIADGVEPTFFSVDVMGLADAIFEDDPSIRFVREVGGAWQEVAKAGVDAILADFDRPFRVVADTNQYVVEEEASGAEVGALKRGASRIRLSQLELPSILDVFVEEAGFAVGSDPDRKSLARYLDVESLFTVLFSDLALAYIDGQLYRDEALVGGGDVFLRHLRVEPLLATATSEKGAFSAGQTAFANGSVFCVVANTIAADDVLICDDLGDEWADFIGVSTDALSPAISFYHAKAGDPSLSASAFHDAVGQGIKNLGRLSLAGEAMAAKYANWDDVYRNGGVTTAIHRIMRGGTLAEIETKIGNVAAAPDAARRVFIVTSSLSRTDVEAAFAAIAAGDAVRPNFVQLYWLLMGFFSACTEIGANGYVICRP